jgi:hypothetical protein
MTITRATPRPIIRTSINTFNRMHIYKITRIQMQGGLRGEIFCAF